VEALRTVSARNGLPEQLVSDNGPQFTAAEFQLFLKKNGVKHITSAPYHPATNGLAERFIQTLKLGKCYPLNCSKLIWSKDYSNYGQNPICIVQGWGLYFRASLS
jgi:transposase InsO family protein